MDSGAFVEIITGIFFNKSRILELRNPEILPLFNNTKVPELRNLGT